MNTKRYQIYLNSHDVSIVDEISEVSPFSRSQIIREMIAGGASRLANLLSTILPPPNNYSELDKLDGIFTVPGKKKVNLSENVDDIYYK